MPINYPTIEDFTNIVVSAFRQRLPEIDPTVVGSFAEAFVRSKAILGRALVEVIRDLEKQLFPQTATDEFLDLWGQYEGLERLSAAAAFGFIAITGEIGSDPIPSGTRFTGANGIEYETTAGGSVTQQSFAVSSITRSINVATVTTPSNHFLATGMTVNISGADQSEYNGVHENITVTALNEFQFNVEDTPATPATGTITYTVTYFSVNIQALTSGQVGNLSSGATVTLNEAITGVDSQAIVQFTGIVGGASEETDEPYRARILLSRSSQSGVFTPDQIRLAALGITGNTRVIVVEPSRTVCGIRNGFAIKGQPSTPNRYAEVSTSGSSLEITGDISISCFITPTFDAQEDPPVNRRILLMKSTDFTDGYGLYLETSTRELQFGNSTGGFSTFSIPLKLERQIMHVAATLTATNNILYINGVEIDNVSGYSLADVAAQNLFMLGHDTLVDRTTLTDIDEVRVYNRILGPGEILQLYQEGIADTSNMQAHWRFSEGEGTTFNDISGNNNHGTLSNADMWTAGLQQGTSNMIPVPGQVLIFILRDNDPNIIPSQTILDSTKEAIIENGKKPAHMYEGDIFVLAPTPEVLNFEFDSLIPDTPTMRTAIENKLKAFFEDNVEFQEAVTEASYLGTIQETQDPITNDFVRSFSLTSPVGNQPVPNGSIAVLGTVTFNIPTI